MTTAWSKRLQARATHGAHGFAIVSQEGMDIQLTVGITTRDGGEMYREIGLTPNMAIDLAHELETAAGKAVLSPKEEPA